MTDEPPLEVPGAQESAAQLELIALPGIPLITTGDDLAVVIWNAAAEATIRNGDILVVAQKIVSKSEGRFAYLGDVHPSERALKLAREAKKDPRVVELILSESREVLRCRPGVIVVRHRRGYVLANAGIDASNVGPGPGGERVLLLPLDPDGSASRIRDALLQRHGTTVGVIINDSLGRAWRNGTIGTALGVAGLPGLMDLRGQPDLFGRRLESTDVGHADELAAAASLVMGQADEGRPVVIVRGFPADRRHGNGAELIRPQAMDLFQ
jgi:coenzyme F420-0:L-glutamate ligase / coenzyme F420-1:gamma-L-glutamate ligase